MRIHVLAPVLATVAMSMIGSVACQAAQAASDITIAAIAAGRLYVVGTTEQPHTPVSLDNRFTTESDETGKFQYELVYHPARCIIAAGIEGKTHEAVVSNCGQQGPVGPPGIAARAPVASPMQTGTLPTPTAATSKLKVRPPTSPPALHASRAPIRTYGPAYRELMHPARYERRKPTAKPKVEQQKPNDEEIPRED